MYCSLLKTVCWATAYFSPLRCALHALINLLVHMSFVTGICPNYELTRFEGQIIFSTLQSLRHLLTMTVSQTSLIFMTLTVWRSADQVFCRTSLNRDLLIFSSWVDWLYGFLGEDHRGKMPIHHITLSCYHHCWCWPWSSSWHGVCQVSPL